MQSIQQSEQILELEQNKRELNIIKSCIEKNSSKIKGIFNNFFFILILFKELEEENEKKKQLLEEFKVNIEEIKVKLLLVFQK